MKKYLLSIFALLTFFMTAPFLTAHAFVLGRTVTVENSEELWQIIADAQDGDIIELVGSCIAKDPAGMDAPLVINKAVTIQGGDLSLRTGGIILDADVTFRNITVSFGSSTRNAIMANGHTLTLENVSCGATAVWGINLFCGGLYDPGGFGSTMGPEGKIIIRGSTSLSCNKDVGNIYAGNLCMGGMTAADSHIQGPANQFNGNASVVIESSGGKLDNIYAGGAQQKIPEGAQSGKVMLTDPERYTTGGRVDISLRGGLVRNVDGAGGSEVHVTYNGNEYSTNNLALMNISGLTVESGYLVPEDGSSFREDAALSVSEGARLGLANYGALEVGSFSGGGTLFLGQMQSLSITGNVTGSTVVGIGYLNNNGSALTPVTGYPYIYAPASGEDSFRLAPPEEYPDMRLLRDENGRWSVSAEGIPVLVESFCFEEYAISISAEECAELPLTVAYAENGSQQIDMLYIPLTVIVNGQTAVRHQKGSGYYYIAEDLRIDISEEIVFVIHKDSDESGMEGDIPAPDGVYAIEIIVPPENTASGQRLWSKAVLTVGDGAEMEENCWIRSVSVEDDQVVVDIAMSTDSVTDGTVFAAAYRANGRMCSIASEAINGAGTVSVPLNSGGADSVKVFIVDRDSQRPICQDHSIVKNG